MCQGRRAAMRRLILVCRANCVAASTHTYRVSG